MCAQMQTESPQGRNQQQHQLYFARSEPVDQQTNWNLHPGEGKKIHRGQQADGGGG